MRAKTPLAVGNCSFEGAGVSLVNVRGIGRAHGGRHAVFIRCGEFVTPS
jgi:hypothetical protein